MIQLVMVGGLIIAAVMILSVVMKIVGIVITIGSWMLAGYLAGRIVRGRSFGIIGDVALGLVGGIVGSILLRLIGLGDVQGVWIIGGILAGTFGAILVIYLVRLFHDKEFGK